MEKQTEVVISKMKTSEAIETVARVLSKGVHPHMAAVALMIDGFSQERAITIVRWALLFNEKGIVV